MFAALARPDVWRALLAGLGYAALYALTSQVVWRGARWLGAQPSAGAVRVQRWRGWTGLGQLAGAAGTLGYVGALALRGVLADGDLGIGWPDAATLPWLLAISAGAALWFGGLWMLATRRSTVRPPMGGWSDWLAPALTHEAQAALWRAALMPWLGSYWGLWASVPVKWLMLLANPARVRAAPEGGAPGGAEERPFPKRPADPAWPVHCTLDCVGAALYFYSRSAWAALAGRVVCGALVWLALKAWSRTPTGG